MRTSPTRTTTASITETEGAILGLLAIEGECSGYDLLKYARKSVGYVWAPAKTQLYAVLPRLVRAGLARSKTVRQADRPDKQLYRITPKGERALRAWLETVVPGSVEPFYLKVFDGVLMSREAVVAHIEQFHRDTEERLAEYRRIEPTNTRRGADYYHYFLLRLGIDRAEVALRWAVWVLEELGEDGAE